MFMYRVYVYVFSHVSDTFWKLVLLRTESEKLPKKIKIKMTNKTERLYEELRK